MSEDEERKELDDLADFLDVYKKERDYDEYE